MAENNLENYLTGTGAHIHATQMGMDLPYQKFLGWLEENGLAQRIGAGKRKYANILVDKELLEKRVKYHLHKSRGAGNEPSA